MKKILKYSFAIALALYLAATGFLYFKQRDILFRPNVAVPDARLLPVEVVTIETLDGLILSSWWHEGDASKPTILYFQGNAGNHEYQVNLTEDLMSAGYSVLMLGFRGYGGNAGEPSEMGFYADARAAIEWLNARGIRSQEIVFYGRSLGTGVATKMASEFDAAGLILQAPYTRITDVGQERYWWLPVEFVATDHFNNIDTIKAVNEPVFIFWGDNDRVIPPIHGARVFEAANEPKEHIVFAGGGHSNIFKTGGNAAVLNWLSRYIAEPNMASAQ